MQLYGCTVWWLSFVWTLFTLSLCVKRGYIGPSMVPGSWDWAGGIFVFLNTFVFFSLARFGFSKKSDEKQRSNKVHPYASEQLWWHIWPTFPLNFMKFSQKMPLYVFYTMVQKSQKWPKTQIRGGGGPATDKNLFAFFCSRQEFFLDSSKPKCWTS